MPIRNLITGWKTSSTVAKIIIGGVLVILLIIAIVGAKSWFQNRAYEKREAQREAERQQSETEKAQLQAEKQKALTEAADANARADTYKQVAESKRADKAATIKELEQIEQEHVQHKAQVEASGGSMSDDELRRELCARLAKRGYPACN